MMVVQRMSEQTKIVSVFVLSGPGSGSCSSCSAVECVVAVVAVVVVVVVVVVWGSSLEASRGSSSLQLYDILDQITDS